MMEAWSVANLSRAKKLPRLKTLLADFDRVHSRRAVPRQTKDAVRDGIVDWASAHGFSVQRHAAPVV